MCKTQRLPTLGQPATYVIKVPGMLDEKWSDWIEDTAVSVEDSQSGLPITVLICTVDQAALQGLLRRLYSMGLPLISVKYII